MSRSQDESHEAIIRAQSFLKKSECFGARGAIESNVCSAGFNSAPFIPRSKVQEFISDRNRLMGILRTVYPEDDYDFHTTIQRLQKDYAAVFCILLRIRQVHLIDTFLKSTHLEDSKLPLGDRPPHGFPVTADRNLYKTFCEEQWLFCAATFEQSRSYNIEGSQILPIVAIEPIVSVEEGGNASILKIKIHPEYHTLSSKASSVENTGDTDNWFVLKSYRTLDAIKYFENEVEAFRRISRGGQVDPGMVTYHGSFVYHETYNIILEYANRGTLDDYFRTQPPPSTGPGILNFWQNLLKIIPAVQRIHEVERENMSEREVPVFQGIHQDIKPSNILVTGIKENTPYNWNFKLADLGISHFKRVVDPFGSVKDKDSYGTRLYGAPECYRGTDFAYKSKIYVSPKCDIWSLGCIFSEAACWVSRGWKGLEDYREQRSDWHEAIEGFQDPGCFHDGIQVIQPVKDQCTLFKDSKRECDHVTRPILDYVTEMLQHQRIRPTANQVSYRLGEIMLKQRGKSNRATQSFRNRPSTPPGRRTGHQPSDSFSPIAKLHIPQVTDRATSESPTSIAPSEASGRTDTTEDRSEPRTVYEPSVYEEQQSLPSRSRGNTVQSAPYSSTPQNRGLDHFPQSPPRSRGKQADYPEQNARPHGNPDAFISQLGSATTPQTRSIEDPPPTPATVALSQSDRPKVPHLSFQKAIEWMELKKRGLAPALPGEELLSRLGSRDVVFLIDDSASMKPHWEALIPALRVLGYMVKKLDKNGMEIHFTISKDSPRCPHSTDLAKACRANRPRQGKSDISISLRSILREYQQQLDNSRPPSRYLKRFSSSNTVKPLNIYILTDAVWEPRSDPREDIRNLATKLDDLKYPPDQVGLQFIQFGNGSIGTERLEYLDSRKDMKLNRDMVDHTPFEGCNVWKILLGAVNRWFDDDKEDGEVDTTGPLRPFPS